MDFEEIITALSLNIMEREKLEQLIQRDFIENNNLICIDEDDIERLRADSDFMDGCHLYQLEFGCKVITNLAKI